MCQLDLAGVPAALVDQMVWSFPVVRLSSCTCATGYPVAEVAHRFDVSPAVVVRNLCRHDLPRRRQAPLDRVTLRRLYVDEQLGVRAVASPLGVSPTRCGPPSPTTGSESARPAARPGTAKLTGPA